mgnify:FL=1
MSRFRSQFRRMGAAALLAQFGEPITYYADGTGGGRPIQAKVERDVAVPSESGDQVALAIIVRVLDSSTEGISATEIDDCKDEVSLPIKEGGSAERRKVGRRMADSNGLVRFMVR